MTKPWMKIAGCVLIMALACVVVAGGAFIPDTGTPVPYELHPTAGNQISGETAPGIITQGCQDRPICPRWGCC